MLILGIVYGLIVGWFFSLFGGNTLIIQGILELTGKEITDAGYYTIFALLGLMGGAIKNWKSN
ncbi:MAG TPA: hypothetical protein GX396_08500 [Tissierellia bacterium]|jgi:hypothetical protein|nr:hypothetical protein [Tissierellia bacterium]